MRALNWRVRSQNVKLRHLRLNCRTPPNGCPKLIPFKFDFQPLAIWIMSVFHSPAKQAIHFLQVSLCQTHPHGRATHEASFTRQAHVLPAYDVLLGRWRGWRRWPQMPREALDRPWIGNAFACVMLLWKTCFDSHPWYQQRPMTGQ